MVVTWDTVKNAVAYEALWRQNNGDWINVPRTGNTRFEVDGIYAGRYVVESARLTRSISHPSGQRQLRRSLRVRSENHLCP